MTADDARQFLQSLNVFLAEDCYESDIDEDIRKVIALVDTERERCAKIADEGMPDQNNIQQREMIQALRPDLSDHEINKSMNEANRHFESCAEYIAMKIRIVE